MDPDIALFAAIVEAGSLSAAGRDLHISPAMVSKRLARLEARLVVRLVHRTTRRLALTKRGEGFHRDVVAILAKLRDAEERVADRSAVPAGPLRISAPTSFGRLHIAPRLKPFLDLYPKIELEIDLSDDFVDLLAGDADVAIRITPRLEPGLEAVRLADSRRILCAAPQYLAERGIPANAAALANHDILAAGGQLPWRLLGPSGDLTVNGKSHVRTNSSEVVRELTVAGVGISLRSLWDISEDLVAGKLVRVLPELQGSADVGIFAAYPKTPTRSASISALLAYLGSLWGAVPPWERPVLLGE
jgi:DNA-binding transcriptional LysR family regulator